VIVSPGAARTRLLGLYDNRLKVQVAAPPEDGKANLALLAFIAETLGVAKAQLEIVGAATNRRKMIRVANVAPEVVRNKLLVLL